MKTMKLASLGLIVISAAVLGAPKTLAADSAANTKADVEFIAPTDEENENPDKPNIVDPNTPDKEAKPVLPGTDPEEGNGGNGKPSFNINWVSNFRFGQVTLGTKMSAFAAPTTLNWAQDNGTGTLVPTGEKTENLAPFLQVTDLRGTNAGWHVQVTGTPFKKVGETTKTLTGAKVFLNEAKIVGVAENSALAPTALSADGKTDILTGTNTVLSAAANKGQGTWSLMWGAGADNVTDAGNGVKLEVPATALPEAEASYVAELTWTLLATPTN